MMPVWGIGSALGFLLDNAGLLSIAPTPQIVIAWNWVGVGLGVALAVTALAARN
jgi:hypothetical protein